MHTWKLRNGGISNEQSNFCGRTTKDIEMRYSNGENSMAIGRFSIAIDSGYGDKKKTNFFNCTILESKQKHLSDMFQREQRYYLNVKPTKISTPTRTTIRLIRLTLLLRVLNFAKASRSQTVSHSLHRAIMTDL